MRRTKLKVMNVKYIRVSTKEQNTARQESNNFEKLYIDKVSGAIPFAERIEASKLIKEIEKGNISKVTVSSVDRLGRNILDILTVLEYFTKNNVCLDVENIGCQSLLPNGDTNPVFKMIVSVLGNVAEMERNTMLERQKQGIDIAKAKGTYKGRLYGTKITDEALLKKYSNVVKELKSGQSIRRSAKLGSCSVGTASKIKTLLDNTPEKKTEDSASWD